MDIVLRFLVFQMLDLSWKQRGCISRGGAPGVTTMQGKKPIYSVAYNLFHGWGNISLSDDYVPQACGTLALCLI